jgi:ParB family chromosome partitioning protein
VSVPLSDDQQQERDRLMGAYDALITEHGEEPDDEIAAELETLWDDIQSIDASARGWRDEDRAIAGVIISINYQGELDIDAGLVRADDVPKLTVVDGDDDEHDAPEEPSPLSSRLTESLTAERTAALRAMMIDNQSVALATLCHALALDIFYGPGERQGSCLDLRLVSRDLRRSGEWIEQGGAQVLVNARHADWIKRLPEDAADLFNWLLTQDSPTQIELLSFCAALSIDAVRIKDERASHPRLVHADQVANALGLDMSLWWSPTKENYLGKVPKALMLAAVGEGVSRQAAENLVNLKKDQLIESAAQKLTGKGWLPALLRSPKPSEEDIACEAMAAE